MNITGDGRGHQPESYICCACNGLSSDEPTRCLWCQKATICVECCPMDAISVKSGSTAWSCSSCSKLSIPNLLTSIAEKLNKIDAIQSEVILLRNDLKLSMERKDHQTDVFTVCNSKPDTYAEQAKKMTIPQRIFKMDRRNSSCSESNAENTKKRKREVAKVDVVLGKKTDAVLKGVKPADRKPPRKHYFISRVEKDVDISSLVNYCKAQNLGQPLACRELPSKNLNQKSFHLVFPEDKSELVESSDIWPEHISVRYFLNEEERTWLKSLADPGLSGL